MKQSSPRWGLADEQTPFLLAPVWATSKRMQPSDIVFFYSTVQTKMANSDSHTIVHSSMRAEL